MYTLAQGQWFFEAVYIVLFIHRSLKKHGVNISACSSHKVIIKQQDDSSLYVDIEYAIF